MNCLLNEDSLNCRTNRYFSYPDIFVIFTFVLSYAIFRRIFNHPTFTISHKHEFRNTYIKCNQEEDFYN